MSREKDASTRLERLSAATRDFVVATANYTTHRAYQGLSEFLGRVREALGMDIAFVSEFVDELRVFRVVSVAADSPAQIKVGDSDPLIDSYCKRVLEGTLPLAIPDTKASPIARALAITKRLRIRAYLSAPIVLKSGQVFGTLCCFSHSARPELGEAEVRGLNEVARLVAATIDAERGYS